MGYKFNPFTGTLDYFEAGSGGQDFVFYKQEPEIDAAAVISKQFNLGATPIRPSIILALNGLVQKSECYMISGQTLTLVPSFDLAEGDDLIINFVSIGA